MALLRRRIACCQEAASVEDLQSHLSALLSNAHTSEGVSPSPSIVPCNAKQPVACPVCGVYFDSMPHMLSHQARQHGCQLPKVPLPKSTDYTAHTVQCLPQCKHCLGVFTRVEGLKKHLRRSCPVLHEGTTPPRETAEATGPGVLGASDREGSLGHSCRIPQAAAAESPLGHASRATESLISNHSFLQALRSGWRLAAATADFQQVLRKHCVYCHQWVSLKSPGIKQHCRLMHPEYWQHKASANSLCSSAGLSSATPCTYCGVQYNGPESTCEALSGPVSVCFGLYDSRPGIPLRWWRWRRARPRSLCRRCTRFGEASPPKVEGQHKRGHGAEADEQEPEKWSKPESKGSWGKGQRWNDKWQSESTKNTALLFSDRASIRMLFVTFVSLECHV